MIKHTVKTISFSVFALTMALFLIACQPGSSAGGETETSQPAATEAAEDNITQSEAPDQTEAAAPAAENGLVVLATTTSVNDSGLMDYLRAALEQDAGITLDIISQGTGQAIKTGESGDADVLLIHSKSAEEQFVADGYGVERIPFMYNYFVIVGPASDPAGIKEAASASEAFKKIYESGQVFVSRGDESGTHSKEKKLWEEAGITPEGDAYVSAGRGMGDTLLMADEKQGYTLTDKATYLSMKDKLELTLLLGESDDLMNQYTLILMNPEKYPDRNHAGAQAFVDWMVSQKGLDMIAQYGIDEYGEALFQINYEGPGTANAAS